MRRIIVSMNITIDGFMADIDGGLDWHLQNWTSDMAELLGEQLRRADTLLLGRNTYCAMAAYWPAVSINLRAARDGIPYADLMNRYEKVVCSNTLKQVSWNNSRVITGNIRQEILRLKQQPGKDIIIYGSSKLISYLTRHNLIDEYLLWVYPITLARGKALFNHPQNFTLINSRQFASGVVVLNYAVMNNSCLTGN
jgi:dihydrofolate reductase